MSWPTSRKLARAFWRFSASSTWRPLARRNAASPCRTAGSSSTRRIRDSATRGLRDLHPLARRREPDDDACPALGPVDRLDGSAMLFDDAFHDREPEPGPALAAREERLEGARESLSFEAGAVVVDGDGPPVVA